MPKKYFKINPVVHKNVDGCHFCGHELPIVSLFIVTLSSVDKARNENNNTGADLINTPVISPARVPDDVSHFILVFKNYSSKHLELLIHSRASNSGVICHLKHHPENLSFETIFD